MNDEHEVAIESAGTAEPPGTVGAVPDSERLLERLDPRVVVYWLVSGVFSWLVLAAMAAGAVFAFRDELFGDWFWLFVTGASVGGTMLLWALISPSLAYARWRFSVDDELMLMRYGIIYHEEKAIPISRLQHVDLTRGPIERLFGLATLVVFTAGTEAASFRLPGLAVDRAHALRDQILIARGDDVI